MISEIGQGGGSATRVLNLPFSPDILGVLNRSAQPKVASSPPPKADYTVTGRPVQRGSFMPDLRNAEDPLEQFGEVRPTASTVGTVSWFGASMSSGEDTLEASISIGSPQKLYTEGTMLQGDIRDRLVQLERDGVITASQREKQAQAHDYIILQQEIYAQVKLSLLPTYEGQYIAFEDGKVLDFDVSSESLALRLYAQRGKHMPLIIRVQTTEQFVSMGSSF